MAGTKQIHFNKFMALRIDKNIYNDILKTIDKRKDLYYSASHFVRASIIRELRRDLPKDEVDKIMKYEYKH